MYPKRGQPLSESERQHCEAVLVSLLRTKGFHLETSEVLRALDWSQARQPDLRDHLERLSNGAPQRLSAALGVEIKSIFCSRTQLYCDQRTVYDPEADEQKDLQTLAEGLRILRLAQRH